MAYMNFYATRLATDIGASDTSIEVEIAPTAVSGRLTLEARNPTQREIISYTGLTLNTLTGVTRGVGGTTARPHTKGSLVEMNVTAEDLTDALNVPNDIETRFNEVISDHVASGLVWTDDTGLTADMSAGVAYINGKRLDVAAVTNRAFTASKDTYVDLGDNGVLDYNEVSNNAAQPSLAASHMRLGFVRTNATDTTLINNFTNPSYLEKADGWQKGLPAVSSVTANGNRSYTVAFASDVSGTLSEGMRLRTTRTVASTQNAFSLDGSNDYYNKTSPTGLSFTTTFTCSAWVYLTSYAEVGIIARRNADTEGWSFGINSNGQLSLVGLRIAANNKSITSYQSIPLGKWVHVAACIDMTAGDTAAQIMWIDGVSVPRFYSLTGTATAIVQGTTALVVGALKSAGTGPFPGYIDQAAVFSSQLSDATIKAMMHQGLTGSESTLVSAYANGSTTDLNTTNANNLTAQNGATTVASAPWGNRGLSTTLDYELVMKVSGTDVTVQVPEGVTIPTTGGITSVAYSTFANPYGFVSDKGRWEIRTQVSTSITTAAAVSGTMNFYSGAFQLTVPTGKWIGRDNIGIRMAASANTYITHDCIVSTTTSLTGYITDSSFENNVDFGSSSTHSVDFVGTATFAFTATTATPVYVGERPTFNGSPVSVAGFYRTSGAHSLVFTPSGL